MVEALTPRGRRPVVRVVRAPAAAVWAVVSDGWLYANWVVGTSRVGAVDSTWPQEGSRIHHSFGVWPAVIDDETVSLLAVPGQRLHLKAKGWPMGKPGSSCRSPRGPTRRAPSRSSRTPSPVLGCSIPSRCDKPRSRSATRRRCAGLPHRRGPTPGVDGTGRERGPDPMAAPEVVDAVVIGAGPNGLVAANALADAGWDVLLVEAVRTRRGRRPQRHRHRSRVRHRPVQRVLPARRGQPGDPRPGPGAARPDLVHGRPTSWRTRCTTGAPRCFTRPRRTPRPGWRSSPGRRGRLDRMFAGLAPHPRPAPRRPVHPDPSRRALRRQAARRGERRTPSTSRGSACCPVRRLGREEFRGEEARMLLTRATRCTATSRRTPPAAPCSAGCWR